jgi:SAM-dependent methyltransferase
LNDAGAYEPDQVRSDFDRIAALPSFSVDHNALYHAELLRDVPQRVGRALDVGCGTGSFARLLAERAEQVDAIDLSPAMIDVARQRSVGHPNIRFEVADFLASPMDNGAYDVIASIATLHHVPLRSALPRLAAALAPGGTLVVLDLLDPSGFRELPRNALAWLYARVLAHSHQGTRTSPEARRAWQEHGRHDRYDAWPSLVATYRELLPGTRLTRHLLWRYSAVWSKPVTPPAARASSSTS